jgi:hypothetical protein
MALEDFHKRETICHGHLHAGHFVVSNPFQEWFEYKIIWGIGAHDPLFVIEQTFRADKCFLSDLILLLHITYACWTFAAETVSREGKLPFEGVLLVIAVGDSKFFASTNWTSRPELEGESLRIERVVGVR